MKATDDLRRVLADTLQGAQLPDTHEALASAEYHGVVPLIFARTGMTSFGAQARARVMWELRHKHVITHLLAAFAAAGVKAIAIKGTALAYDLYDDAALRPRGDTDILIPPDARPRARMVLEAQGFVPRMGEQMPEGFLQETWKITPPGGTSHHVDMHWQTFSSPALSHLVPVDEALTDAVPLPRLGPDARALSRPHGLIHSCVHRAQHILYSYYVAGKAHYGGDRLIWLYDIDLLARALTPEEWTSFTTRAGTRGIAPICVKALREAHELLGTPLPDTVMTQLDAAPSGPATRYLLAKTIRSRAIDDLRSRNAGEIWQYLRIRLLPPATVVREHYPDSRAPLAILYVRRIIRFVKGGRF